MEVAEGRPERALKLLSVAEQLIRAGNQMPDRWTGPFDRRSIDRCIGAARAAITEQAADEAWQTGASLSLGEGVALGLELAFESAKVNSV